jgi:hypothetical protein
MRMLERLDPAQRAEMHTAIRAWLSCPAEKRPSAQALGQRIAEIAASMVGAQ